MADLRWELAEVIASARQLAREAAAVRQLDIVNAALRGARIALISPESAAPTLLRGGIGARTRWA